MDVGKAFSFVFEDRNWFTKLVVGGLIALIPIFGIFALMGYMIAVIRRVMDEDPNPLPEWSDLGQKFVDGLLIWVAGLIYALPMLLLLCPVVFVWILPALGGEREDAIAALTSVAGLVTIGLGCIILLYALLLVFLGQVINLQYAGHGRLGACLRVGDIVRFTLKNVGNLLLIVIILIGVGAGINLVVGLISGALNMIPCVGQLLAVLLFLALLPLEVWLIALQGHLIGQLGRQSGLPSPRWG